jgi:hypothetical protein
MLEYVHFCTWSMRLKISELRDHRRTAEAEAYAVAIPVVKNVVANPVTGSLTINFAKDEIAISCLWDRLYAQGYASGPCPKARISRSVTDMGVRW